MKPRDGCPGEEELRRAVYEELSAGETQALLGHAEECPTCRVLLGELTSVKGMLDRDLAADPLRPMWPRVRERMLSPASPRPRLSFALVSSAALIAGILIGVLVGSAAKPLDGDRNGFLWTTIGSEIMGGSSERLSDIYLENISPEGG